MSRTRIKICGINTPEAALAAAQAGADAIGLVFVERSPRHVTIEQASAIIAALPAFVQPVGLFCDESTQKILDVAHELSLHAVQLHGRETPEDVMALSPLAVIKAVAFDQDQAQQAQVLKQWRSEVANVAAVLVDAPPPVDAQITGGHGQSFDWNAMASSSSSHRAAGLAPIILAGGLTPRNVAQAIRTIEPYAVDVSSGVESSRGVKDLAKIRSFCEAVRDADVMRE